MRSNRVGHGPTFHDQIDPAPQRHVAVMSGREVIQQFHHCAHIAVALTYLAEAPVDDATVRMRQTLQKFTQRHGVNVYHETVTRFWMKLLDHLATTHYRDMPLWRRINLIVERWAVTDPIAAHYSHSVISSRAARESWIAPDRLPLPF